MPGDRAVAARGITPAHPQTSKVGNRGTGAVTYHFRLPTSNRLRAVAQQVKALSKGRWAFEPFHLNVYVLLFGPQVKNTRFVADRQYATKARQTYFGDYSGLLNGNTFSYDVSKKVIDWVGRILKVTPAAITINGKRIADIERIADIGIHRQLESIKINAALNKLPPEARHIFHTNIGVDISDARVWKRLIIDRGRALDELNKIVTLLGELDDEAYVALIKNLPRIHNASGNHAPRLDLERLIRFRASLEKLKTKSDDRALKGRQLELKLEQEATSLVGLHELYFLVKERNGMPEWFIHSQSVDPGAMPDNKYLLSPRLTKLNEQISLIQAKNNIGPNTLQKLEKQFLEDFQRRAAAFARRQLNRYLRLLEFYAKRTDADSMAREINAYLQETLTKIFKKTPSASLTKIKEAVKERSRKYDELITRFPIMTYVAFWDMYWHAHNNRHQKHTFVFNIGIWNIILSETRKSIIKVSNELKDDPSYIWKGDIFAEKALERFGMYAEVANGKTHNAMLTDMVKRKLRAQQNSGGHLAIILGTVVAIALSLTGVGLLIAAGTVISIVVSIHEVYLMIEDQGGKKIRKKAGFSSQDPPSDFWILITFASIGADVGGFVKLLKAGKGSNLAKGAKEMDQLLNKAETVSKKLREVLEAGKKNKENLEVAWLQVKAFTQKFGSLNDAVDQLAEAAYYLARLGLTQFNHFVIELARRGLLKQINKSSSYNEIMAKLPKDTQQLLKQAHGKGLDKGLKDLDKTINATDHQVSARSKPLPDDPSLPQPARKPGAADRKHVRRAPADDMKQLREKVKNPKNIQESDRLGYDKKIEIKDHAYHRRTSDGVWCKFSEPECGFELDPDLEKKIAGKGKKGTEQIAVDPRVRGNAAEDAMLAGKLGAMGFTKIPPHNFKTWDGMKGERRPPRRTSNGSTTHYPKEITSVKSTQVTDPKSLETYIINRYLEPTKGDTFVFGKTRVHLGKNTKRRLDVVFEQGHQDKIIDFSGKDLRKLLVKMKKLAKKKYNVEFHWYVIPEGTVEEGPAFLKRMQLKDL